MDQYNNIRRRTIENATLLWSLAEVVEKPSENILRREEGGWSLPVERESQLADDLAFIAVLKDDPNQIMAVCIEEAVDQSSMVVRVASNTGCLDEEIKGLQSVANLMVQATARELSRCVVRHSLLTHIVSMDKARILSRLRSRHAARTQKTRGKPSLPLLLWQTVNEALNFKRVKTSQSRSTRAQARSQSQQLWETSQRLEDTGDDTAILDLLHNIITLAHEFDIAALVTVLQGHPKIDPSTTSYLPEALRKLSRYYQIAQNLTEAARSTKYPLFQSINVMPVQCNSVDSQKLELGLSTFDQTWTRIASANSNSLPATRNPQASAQTKYQNRMFHCSTKWKVHAEIQLLLFYEFNPKLRRPRMICSSKSACYLCNLFLRTHGLYQNPRTHGRIYDKWVLPSWSPQQKSMLDTMSPIITRFNEALETQILAVLRRKRMHLDHPNESVVAECEPWSSNSTIRPPQPASIQSLEPQMPQSHANTDLEDVMRCSPRTSRGNSSVEEICAEDAANAKLPSILESESGVSDGQNNSISSIASDNRIYKRVVTDGKSLLVNTNVAKFHFSISDNLHDQANSGSAAYWMTVEPTNHEFDDSDDTIQTIVVDVDTLESGCAAVVPVNEVLSRTKLIFKRSSNALSIRFHLET